MPEKPETRQARRVLTWLLAELTARGDPKLSPLILEAHRRMARPYKRRRSDPDAEEVRAAYDQASTLAEAAQILGVGKMRLRALLDKHGLEWPGKEPVTAAEIRDMVRMYKKGMSTVEIGEVVQRSPSTVYRHLKSAGVAVRKRKLPDEPPESLRLPGETGASA